MFWMLVCVGVFEMVLVHLLVAMWNVWVAFGLTVASFAGLVWLIREIRAFRTRPVRIVDGELVLALGTIFSVGVPIADISGLRDQWTAKQLKEEKALNLALLSAPNIVVDFARPVEVRGRKHNSVAHRIDDPAAFQRALEQERVRHG